ncbi:hypothetical protein VE01_03982 [Pseudogymnoascus verrucosus]|uniref:RRM domain-containing protein n=1 Tax=Pseudogymnoascus verrucosus TaxID=342668 RepID=A0A1B8GQ37_9PEZI|nr:uncharacterized protein VE01_03982 [Pseudogymnoascus verrucosus]OBT97956.1 hypothetical protein VE01_03982 [Pseudogymnoascus verrucosus]
MARNAAGALVYRADGQTEVAAEEIEQYARLLRGGYYPSHEHPWETVPVPERHAWGRPPAPQRPPGLGAATSENAALWYLIPEAEQFWPAEFRQFDRRYAGALITPPVIIITSAGGPIRRPTGQVAGQAASPSPAASGSQTGRTSRGAFVQLAGFFTVDQLRSSVVIFPPRNMEGESTAQQGLSLAGGGSTLPPVAPRGSVFHRPQLSASAPAFIPRTAAPEFFPRAATLAAQPATSVTVTTFPSSTAVATSNPVPIVNLPPPSASVASKPAATPNCPSEDSRMVVLSGIPGWVSVANMADSVSSGHYGALFAIQFGADYGKLCARIIFRDAAKMDINPGATPGAKGYFDALTAAKSQPWADRSRALWPFPPGCAVDVRLENFAANAFILGMRPSLGEDGKRIQAVSRRLSLVGLEQLFSSFGEKEMRNAVVGGGFVRASSIERVCIYNSGNATIVFADVPSAVQALKRFETYNTSVNDALKIKASHSKDPCEVVVQYTPNDSFAPQPTAYPPPRPRPGPK